MTLPAAPVARPPIDTVLVLTADTGGGHRAVADALSDALSDALDGRFATVVCDPLTGARAHPLLRRACRWYGPVTRLAPWLWWLAFHATNAPVPARTLRRLLTPLVAGPIAAAMVRYRPAVVVCTHPLVVDAAVAARAAGTHPAIVTVVTDLATAHRTWWHPDVDRTIAPSPVLLHAGARAGTGHLHPAPLGIPLRAQFRSRGPGDRAALGIRPGRFVVLVTAGGEGGRGLAGWTRTIARRLPDVDVVAVCGRDARLRARLSALAARSGGRVIVTGHLARMADWMRCADLVVAKAGPATIAEAAALGVPLLLAGHVPGQEAGNAALAVAVGAARRVRGPRRLAREIDALRRDPVARAAMRSAALRSARPHAAHRAAGLVAALARTTEEEA